jgi:hypothetical protein
MAQKRIDQLPATTPLDSAVLPVSISGVAGSVTLDAAVASTSTIAAINARTDLGAMAPAVQTLIDNSIAVATPVFNQLENKTGTLLIDHVGGLTLDGQTFATLAEALNYVNNKAGSVTPTAPVLSAVPTVNDSTADEGQTITITKATWTGTQPTSWYYEVIIGGVVALTTAATNAATTAFVMPVVPVGAANRTFVIRQQLIDWPGVNATSAQGSVNVPALPVPQTITRPNITVSGNTFTGNHGLYDRTVISYAQRWLDSGNNVLGTATTLDTTNYAGLQIRFAETPTGVNGAGPEAISDPVQVSGGTAPTYTGTGVVLPGIVAGTFAVGTPLLMDFGAPLNNPNPAGYSYQVYRNGVAIAGATGSNKTSPQSYTPVSADEGTVVSFSVIASNGAGSSAPYYAPGEVIGAAAGGGSSAPIFIGASKKSQSTVGTSGSISLPTGTLAGHFALLAVSTDTNTVNYTTPTGWSIAAAKQSVSLDGQSCIVYSKVIAQGETDPVVCAWDTSTHYAIAMAVYSGPTAVIGTPAVITSSASNASPVTVPCATVTTNATNQKVVLIVNMDSASASPVTATYTQPSAFVERIQTDINWSTEAAVMMISDYTEPTAGATGTLNTVATMSSGTGHGYIGFTVALATIVMTSALLLEAGGFFLLEAGGHLLLG